MLYLGHGDNYKYARHVTPIADNDDLVLCVDCRVAQVQMRTCLEIWHILSSSAMHRQSTTSTAPSTSRTQSNVL